MDEPTDELREALVRLGLDPDAERVAPGRDRLLLEPRRRLRREVDELVDVDVAGVLPISGVREGVRGRELGRRGRLRGIAASVAERKGA